MNDDHSEPTNDEPTTTTAPVDVPDTDELDDVRGGSGLSWGRVVALVLAFAWLAGAFGWFLGSQDTSPGPSSVEVGFYQDMIDHHDQARTMALIELEKGENSTVKSFAQEIIIFQQYEIGLMDQSLAQWGFARSERPATAMEWMGMPTTVGEMPGMASQAELDELNASTGRATDELFLELMAKHHRGGVHMASYAAANTSNPQVRRLAKRMERNQAVEVNEFAQTAERLGFDVTIEMMDVPDR